LGEWEYRALVFREVFHEIKRAVNRLYEMEPVDKRKELLRWYLSELRRILENACGTFPVFDINSFLKALEALREVGRSGGEGSSSREG